jgi:uncharacterized protein (TIGR03492 family)
MVKYNERERLGSSGGGLAGLTIDRIQITPAFAEAQTRLLGESVILVPQPHDVRMEIQRLLQQPDRLQSIEQNRLLRMGTPGAAIRIAECLISQFVPD